MKYGKTGITLVALTILASGLQAAIPTAQRQALIALYESTGGNAWVNNSGWKTPPLDVDGFALPGTENTWYGITTDAGNSTVRLIHLQNNNLSGPLPSGLSNLTGLQELLLYSNSLTGSIPAELGSLANLQRIYLGLNQFAGTIPAALGNLGQLVSLHLLSNQLSGSIPEELGSLSNLQDLSLHSNQLSGAIPAILGSLSKLISLSLNNNQLSGSIPVELGNLNSLQLLYLQTNQLSGSIPPELGNLGQLQDLRLFSNQLTGSIPTELGDLGNLRALFLGLNQLTGGIPAELGGLDNLQALYLHHNQLSGPIPVELCGLTSLEAISLDANQLSGSIPVEINGLTNLRYLYLNTNQLTGAIPAEISQLTLLEDLFLFGNQLSGTIPSELGGLTNLVSLYLDSNQLTGVIPAALGGMTHLENVSLDSNQLTGGIPSSLGSLSNLQTLYLNSNHLNGSIPPELGGLGSLRELYLQGNMLTGAIPASLTNLVNLDSAATDLGYNALYASGDALISFLNSRDADWASTQTVAPSDVAATALNGANILVSWQPIAFTGDTGYYTVYSSGTAGGPYASVGQTANKSAGSYEVNGLIPGQTYYFVVRAHTDAHAGNLNAVDSGDSEEASATAWTQVNVRIAGTVTTGGSPLAGVLMSGLPMNPVTNSSGVYDVTLAAGWSGTVTPSLAGYTFSPAFRTYTTVTSDQLNQGYEATFIPPTITVTSPNGGESWVAGSSHNVTWTATGMTGSVTIDLYKGGVYQRTLGTAAATAGTYAWTIAGDQAAGTDYRALVWQAGISDDSNADFAITAAAVRKDDFLATWDGQGVYYKNSDTGAWVKMASPATMITCGDFDNDGVDDLAGLWPSQGGIWVKYSSNGVWVRLSSTARYIATGDMNGDGRVDLLGTWDGQGVYYRNSVTGVWVKMASEATMIACGDLDGDGIDDLIGLWPTQGGIWVKYSHNNAWAQISSTARHISAGDMNGDGRDDLLGTWDGQGAFYRNSISGAWVKLASAATLITTGDVDGDATDDLIGIWPTQGGVWVKYSHNNAWALLGSTARDISAGKMRPAAMPAPETGATAQSAALISELPLPMGGVEPGPEAAVKIRDESKDGPGGRRFVYMEEPNLQPRENPSEKLTRRPGPDEPFFIHETQTNLAPTEAVKERVADRKKGKTEKRVP